MIDPILQHIKADQPNAIERLKTYLSIPSVSTDPAFAQEAARAAQWTADYLSELELTVKTHETPGHPIVIATNDGDDVPASAPRVLFYGHYDVQPADPLDEWTTPPFEPTIRDGAIVARGSSDDKGQVCCFLEALRAWKQVHGKIPVHVTVMIEGEEECGSTNLQPFIESHKNELNADIAIISDTTMWDPQTVAITYGLRGLLYFDIKLHHTNRDLHSGMYGGVLANPANELAAVLGRLFDDQHRVTIPGFYDDVLDLTDDEREAWLKLDYDNDKLFKAIDAACPHGEAGFTTLERKWARPSCDINGLYSGYMGAGAKTIIPSFAGAKVSFRLAANQKANKIAEAFTKWLQSQDVHGCRWEITPFGQADPVIVSSDSPYVTASSRAIEQTSGRPPVLIREGATIPVVADFKHVLGIDTLLIGFGLNDDRIHAPNEKFNLANFELGCLTHAAVLGELAVLNPSPQVRGDEGRG